MLAVALWTAVQHGGCRRPWGSTAVVPIYRRNLVGVLCSLVLLASVVRTPYEVNIPLRKEGTYVIRSAYYFRLVLAQEARALWPSCLWPEVDFNLHLVAS